MENMMMLRVPPHIASQLNDMLANDNMDEIELNFDDTGRRATFVLGGESLPATLLDLPCITEAHKVIDGKVLVKSGDIGQMLVVHEEDKPPAHRRFESQEGLSPAARQRWTRKKLLKRYSDRFEEVDRKLFNLSKQISDKSGPRLNLPPSRPPSTPGQAPPKAVASPARVDAAQGASASNVKIKVMNINQRAPNPNDANSEPLSPSSNFPFSPSNQPFSPPVSPPPPSPGFSPPMHMSPGRSPAYSPAYSPRYSPAYSASMPPPTSPVSVGSQRSRVSFANMSPVGSGSGKEDEGEEEGDEEDDDDDDGFLADVERAVSQQDQFSNSRAATEAPEHLVRTKQQLEAKIKQAEADIEDQRRNTPQNMSRQVQERFEALVAEAVGERTRLQEELADVQRQIDSHRQE